MSNPSIPGATYRLQLHADFGFADAEALVPYLADLGVTHLYLSPVLKSTRGSTHGYDIVDPRVIDEARGGESALRSLSAKCDAAGLGMIVDIVPNHLDISNAENPLWQTVLAVGPESRRAEIFDIEWQAHDDRARVLLPVLGETLPEAIWRGLLSIQRHDGWLYATYYDKRFPLSVESVAEIARDAGIDFSVEDSARRDLPELAENFAAACQERIAELDGAAATIGVEADRLADLLDQQHYRLMLWRKEGWELNYRRFFDINTMIGTRVDRDEVFDVLHEKILALHADGVFAGLRVDHPDGLRDPTRYFEMLARASDNAWVVAEKILETGEPLPDWPVAGTTGYDYLNDVLGVLVNPAAEGELTGIYADFARVETSFAAVAFEAKHAAAHTLLAADLARLTEMLLALAPHDPRLDHDRSRLAEAIAMLATCTPVYRTYARPEDRRLSEQDAHVIDEALRESARLRPDLAPDPLEGVADLLRLRSLVFDQAEAGEQAAAFVTRFQQFSSPVMAKGVEDTAFYRFNRFVALNEVGGDPAAFGITPETFHQRCESRASRFPSAMLSTATHDTKRSEDVRARLAAISEQPTAWGEAVGSWHAINEAALPELAAAIERNDEFLFYQAAVGAWPIESDRLTAFMTKAAREAKVRTSWRSPDEAYEASLTGFIEQSLQSSEFREALEAYVATIRTPGRVKSIVQTLLRLTCPGVPDTYQGTELWDLSLVDPDNRRPVDYARRREILSGVRSMSPSDIWASLDDPDDLGVAKMFIVERALGLRQSLPDAFGPASGYRPLRATGDGAERLVAFARTGSDGRSRAVVVAPCGPDAAGRGWSLELPESQRGWRNALGGSDAEGSRELASGVQEGGAILAGGAPVALFVEG